ncbi:MAG: hypothetical protein V4864_01465 [Pseudomonadota bacterium]
MLPALASANHPARRRLFWATLAALAFAQLSALWLLCNHQVQAAEARHSVTRMERMVLADCLRYVPGATLATCSGQLADASRGATVPVGYTYH